MAREFESRKSRSERECDDYLDRAIANAESGMPHPLMPRAVVISLTAPITLSTLARQR